MAEEKQTQKVESGEEKGKKVEEVGKVSQPHDASTKPKAPENKVEVPEKVEVEKEVEVPERKELKEDVKDVDKSDNNLEKEIKKDVEKLSRPYDPSTKPKEPEKNVAKTKDVSKAEPSPEREYIIPLRKKWKNVPRYKRAKKAVKSVKEFLVRHMKVRDGDLNKIRIDKYLNEAIWARGIRKPLSKVKVKVFKDGEVFRAELADMPEKLKYKKARLEKRNQKAQDIADNKKTTKKLEDKVKEQVSETVKEVEEKKKEESEKKASVIEAGEKRKKATAKQVKHQTKISKGPKRPQRKALAK